MGKGRFIWAFTTGLHHFKEYFPIVSLTAHGKCISSLKNLSLTHNSILCWSLDRWLWEFPAHTLCRNPPPLSTAPYCMTRGLEGPSPGPLSKDLNIFRRKKIGFWIKRRVWRSATIFFCILLPMPLFSLTLHLSGAGEY